MPKENKTEIKNIDKYERIVIHEIDTTIPIGSKCHHGKGDDCNVDRTQMSKDIPKHEALNLTKQDMLNAIRNMYMARYTDEKHLNLVKQGKSFFHIGGSGHEAVQTAIAFALKPKFDWSWSYYRDAAYCYQMGYSLKDYFLLALAKKDDPATGGRQMPNHYGHKELNIPTQSSSTGTQFLNAVGTALAAKKNKTDDITYVASGEGTTSQGEFYEAVNWATREKLAVLFCVQDNGYAISVPRAQQSMGSAVVHTFCCYSDLFMEEFDGADFFESLSAARKAVDYLRAGKGPALLHGVVERLLPHSSSDDQRKYRPTEDLEYAKSNRDPIIILKKYLLDYNIATEEEIKTIYSNVKKEIDDTVEWVMQQPDPSPENSTKQIFSEVNNIKLKYSDSEPKEGNKVVFVDAVNHALHEEMKFNDKMLIFGEDVEDLKGGVFTATKNLSIAFGKERVFNSPLAEASIAGVALGLALRGYKPVVEIQFGDYIWPAFQQIRNEISTMRYRSDGHFSCPLVIRVAVGGYIHGGLCHSQNIEAFFAHIPGIYIAYPSTAADAKGLLKSACRMDDPIIFCEHKGLYRLPYSTSIEPDENYLLPFGKGKIVKEGKDATIVAWGMCVKDSINAVRNYEKKTNKTIEIIDLRTIVPWDKELVLNSMKKTNRVLIAHEDIMTGGFGGEIASFISNKGFRYLDAPVLRVAAKDSPIPYAPNYENDVLPNEQKIYNQIEELLNF